MATDNVYLPHLQRNYFLYLICIITKLQHWIWYTLKLKLAAHPDMRCKDEVHADFVLKH